MISRWHLFAVAAVVGVGVAGVAAADVVVAVVVVVGGGGVVVADVVAVVVGGVAVVAVVVGGVVVVAVVGLLWVGVVVNGPPGEVHCLSRVDVPKSHAGLGALYGLGSLVECAVAVAVVVDNVAAVAVDLLCVEYVVTVLLVVFQWKVGTVEVWRRDCLMG